MGFVFCRIKITLSEFETPTGLGVYCLNAGLSGLNFFEYQPGQLFVLGACGSVNGFNILLYGISNIHQTCVVGIKNSVAVDARIADISISIDNICIGALHVSECTV